ncbi:MAG: PQQ-binding-like beta-propeller repeat protein [Polyangiales bacterium]
MQKAPAPRPPSRPWHPLALGCALLFAAPPLIAGALGVWGLLRGLFTPMEHYWTSGCVTRDETTLAVTGDEAVLVDLRDGTIRSRFSGYFDHVVCLPGGDIFGLTPNESVSLTTRTRAGRNGSGSPAASIDERTVLLLERPSRSSGQRGLYSEWSGPLELRTESFGPAPRRSLGVPVSPERLPGVGAGPIARFATLFVRRLDSGEVLVAAGFLPSSTPSDPTHWADGRTRGLHRVDLTTGAFLPHGASLGAAEAACLLMSATTSRATASADGSVVHAVCADGEDRLELLRLVPKTGTGTVLARFDEARESSALALTSAGDRIAIATVAPDGSSGRVTVVDTATGLVLFRTERFRGWVQALEWLRDGSLVVATSKREYQRCDGTTGAVVWSATAPP